MKNKPTSSQTVWMLPCIAIFAALIPVDPLLVSLPIILLILVNGMICPERLYRTALLNTASLYFGLLTQAAFSHFFFNPFNTFQLGHIVYAFPFVWISIVFILMFGSFLKSIFVLPEE